MINMTTVNMTSTGKMNLVSGVFEWSIDNFFSLPAKVGESTLSPLFSCAEESWYLKIYPNGEKESDGYISLFLCRKFSSSDPPIYMTYSLELRTFDGKKISKVQYTHVFESSIGYGTYKFQQRSALLEKKSELVPSDVLTIVFTLEYYSKSTADAGNIVMEDCSYCKNAYDSNYISSHKQKCLEKPIRCQTCNEEVLLKELINHLCNMTKVKVTESLVKDLEGILECKEHSDVTIQVKDTEFLLHRNILAGRNSYFRSMFTADMKEKATGVVSIDDCDPDVFASFIKFLYAGEILLSYDNVCALYNVADKYQEDILKAECSSFMTNKISVDSFCDFTILALKHDVKELLESATKFFCLKVKEVIRTAKWQTFMIEYPTQANELYFKAADHYTK